MSKRIVDDPSLHGWVDDNGKWVWGNSGGSGISGDGTGAGMIISETEPTDKVEGMQWLNPTTGLVLFWDDEKWLQMPGGVNGADGSGNIADGEAENVIARWDSAADQWVPVPEITVSGGSPNAVEFAKNSWLRFKTIDEENALSIRDDRIYVNRPGGAGLAFWSAAKTGEVDRYDTAIVPIDNRGGGLNSGGSATTDLGVPPNTLDENGSTAAVPFRNGYFSGEVRADRFETPEANGNMFSLSNNKFAEADTGTETAYYGMTLDTSTNYWTRFSGFTGVAFYTNGLKRMSIDDKGDATFTGTVSASGVVIDRGMYRQEAGSSGIRLTNQSSILPTDTQALCKTTLLVLVTPVENSKTVGSRGTSIRTEAPAPSLTGLT